MTALKAFVRMAKEPTPNASARSAAGRRGRPQLLKSKRWRTSVASGCGGSTDRDPLAPPNLGPGISGSAKRVGDEAVVGYLELLLQGFI
jgi:hypothetical protein